MAHPGTRRGWISSAVLCLLCPLCLLCTLLGGCTRHIFVPQQGVMDVQTSYDRYVSQGSLEGEADFRKARAQQPERRRRSARLPVVEGEGGATEGLFPRLFNPVLYMYVFPHLVGVEGLPVPGYTTAFRLYERDHFAQPGEETPP